MASNLIIYIGNLWILGINPKTLAEPGWETLTTDKKILPLNIDTFEIGNGFTIIKHNFQYQTPLHCANMR